MTPLQLKRKRLKLGLRTQVEAAAACGVTPGAWSHFETGRRSVPQYVEIILECIEAAVAEGHHEKQNP